MGNSLTLAWQLGFGSIIARFFPLDPYRRNGLRGRHLSLKCQAERSVPATFGETGSLPVPQPQASSEKGIFAK